MYRKILLLIFILYSIHCNRESNKAEKQRESQFLLNYLRNNSSSNPLQGACFQFTAAESTCINVPDDSSLVCSVSEYERLKINITAAEKRTDTILIAFFNCWKSCVILYNTNDTQCTNTKYPSTSSYREKIKSATSSASISWGACMEKCNSGSSEEIGLKGTGAIFTGQPY